MKKLNFFILGAPKCGTTSIYNWLKQHKDIYFPDIKELHFFSTDLKKKNKAIDNLDSYLSLFEGANHSKLILGEASVFYLYSSVAIDNILNFNKDAKFLVMLRNPVDMAVSLHRQYYYTGNEIYKDFEKAWRLQNVRINGIGVTKITEDPQLLQYGKVCKLGEQVNRLLNKVDEEKVKFILLSDIKKYPEKVLEEIFDFLNISEESVIMNTHNVATSRKSPKLHRLIKYLDRYKEDLGLMNFNTGIGKLINKFNTKESENIKLSVELKDEITEYFKDDIILLMNLIKRNLNHWINH